MDKRLAFEAIAKFFMTFIVVGCLIFISAGDFYFIQGWIFMTLIFAPMLVIIVILSKKNPELLKKRIRMIENNKSERVYKVISCILLAIGLIVTGLDYRFRWLMVPTILTIIGISLFIIGYILYTSISKEYLDFYEQIQNHASSYVITGIYSVVRHPMYAVTLILYISIPLILASVISLGVFMLYPIIIVIRIHNEEKKLMKNEDYRAYTKKVKYRLIPFIW